MNCQASRHGTVTAYQVDRCRCPEARKAQSRYRKQLRLRHERGLPVKVSSVGTIRRIEALMVVGWTRQEIMRRVGLAPSGSWPRPLHPRFHINTATKVARLYCELADTRGPSRWTRTWALNRGYLPPEAWHENTIDNPASKPYAPPPDEPDPIAVERALRGEQVKLRHADRVYAILLLTDAGKTVCQISVQLGMNRAGIRRVLAGDLRERHIGRPRKTA